MADTIVVVDESVAELFTKLKGSSVGLLKLKCNGKDVATLEKLGLVRVQEADEMGGLVRVKALPAAWEVEIRIQ